MEGFIHLIRKAWESKANDHLFEILVIDDEHMKETTEEKKEPLIFIMAKPRTQEQHGSIKGNSLGRDGGRLYRPYKEDKAIPHGRPKTKTNIQHKD